MDAGDAFIILPGGIGTLEEFSDTLSHYRIYGNGKRPPILLINLDHIYDPLKVLFENWLSAGFVDKEDLSCIHCCEELEEVMEILKQI